MSTKTQGISLEIIEGPNYERDADGWEHYAYKLRLTYEGRTMDTPYRAGLLHTDDPTVADVMESLCLDSSGFDRTDGFEDWAHEYGYDADSRKAERLYNAVGEQRQKLAALLLSDYDAIVFPDA